MSMTDAPARTFGRSRTLTPNAKGGNNARATGWGAYHKTAAQVGEGNAYLKVEEEKKIVKLLDADPFDFYTCHWVEKAEGSKSITCWNSLLDDDGRRTMPECPLCETGNKPTKVSAFFNVVSLENPTNPEFKVWEMGKQAADQLAEYSEEAKTSPLNRDDLYFCVSKAKGKGRIEYRVKDVKARDLADDWGIEPLTEEQTAAFDSERKTERLKEPLGEKEMIDLIPLLPA